MEQLRLQLNSCTTEDQRKNVANEMLSLLKQYQKADFSPVPYDYLNYLMEYISPELEVPKSKRIAIYCGKGSWQKWDSNSVSSGIGGSEEAVIYAAQVLANRNFNVTIFGSPPELSLHSLPNSNPRFANASEFDVVPATSFEILIVWRCQNLPEHMLLKGKYRFNWLHDTGAGNNAYQVSKEMSGVFFLSKNHKSTFPQLDLAYTIAGNGIVLDHFKNVNKVPRDPYKCIYASNYGRGLSILLYVWPQIKEAVKNATLEIVYGRETYNVLDKDTLYNMCKSIEAMKSLGVTEHGKVGHQELADIMMGCGVWTYPFNCGTSETYCITAVKAAAAGLISVSTKEGALIETIDPKSSLMVENNINTMDGINEFRDKVIDALVNHEKYEYMRELAIKHASNRTWDHVVDKWFELYNEVKTKRESVC